MSVIEVHFGLFFLPTLKTNIRLYTTFLQLHDNQVLYQKISSKNKSTVKCSQRMRTSPKKMLFKIVYMCGQHETPLHVSVSDCTTGSSYLFIYGGCMEPKIYIITGARYTGHLASSLVLVGLVDVQVTLLLVNVL